VNPATLVPTQFAMQELLGLVALATMLVGMWLNWQRHRHIEQIEEDVKNGKLTGEQAWRRSRFVHRRATVVVCLGMALVLAFVIGLKV
jgi:hypothetical protein